MVSSPQVATKIQIWFPMSISFLRGGSISTEVVTVDAFDMLVRKGIYLCKVCRVVKGPEM